MLDGDSESRRIARWQAVTDLVWTHYDDGDEWVVYNPASADIHLLTASAYRLWALISSELPLLSDDLVSRLAAELGRVADNELATATREALAFMDRAGLIRPVWS